LVVQNVDTQISNRTAAKTGAYIESLVAVSTLCFSHEAYQNTDR